MEHGTELIKVRDSDFFARPIDSMAKLAELIQKEKDKIPYLMVNGYPGTVKEKKVALVKKMNCITIGIGVESGNEELRRNYLNRRASNKVFINAVNSVKEHGIRVCSFNMMGIPTETRENVFETINLNREAGVDLADIGVLFPFPGTRIHDIVKAAGLFAKNWKDVIYYHSEAVLDMPQLSQREINSLIKVFQLYMNSPKVFWPIIKRAEQDDWLGERFFRWFSAAINFARAHLSFG